ncbi:anti-sigma factor [Microbacterium sulfonylureivorans]|uniref:anti-sigma factor n=1 Tax=Microbacterium sulfonylureivorans TaxID=2486854 RepID=UPI000FD9CF1C|nr:anti-sigma factor [Microbacterium sulfonylureivorans]
MDEQEFAELSAGFVLNALSPADRQAFDAARALHPEWEHWITADADTAVALADAVPDSLPPLTLRSTLLSRIATMPQLPDADAAEAAAADPVATRPEASVSADDPSFVEPAPTTSTIQAISRRNWTRGLLTLAASMVILVVLGFGAVSINQYVNRPPAVAALAEIEAAPDSESATTELDDGGTATAHWSASVGKAVLVSDGLPEIADDQSYELWFVRDGAAVSAGTFEPAGDDAVTALLDGAMEPGDTIAVTVEPQGGSPTGEPSSEPIVTIPTA